MIPPAYANAIRLSAVNASNRSALTEPKLYAYSDAGDAGDRRADAERDQLDHARVDRRRGGGALVGAHGEHPLPEIAAPDPGRRSRTAATVNRERDPAEHRARQVAVESAERRPRPEVEPEQRRLGYGRARSARRPRWC